MCVYNYGKLNKFNVTLKKLVNYIKHILCFCDFSCLNCFRIIIKQKVEAVLKELFHVSQKHMCFAFVIIVKKPENKQTKRTAFYDT